ncbi:MAG: Hsp20/alpha crystallin family protein [Candidatus Taylorbacteria bacterium]
MKDRRSFFERLTGSVHVDEMEEEALETRKVPRSDWKEETEADSDGQLTVDVYQNPTDIIIRTMVAGVRPEDLDISITREMVTIKGKRESGREISEQDYFFKELYWGTFSRTILLPQEVEVEDAEATEKFGLLTLRLPKINKEKQTKLKVKSNT